MKTKTATLRGSETAALERWMKYDAALSEMTLTVVATEIQAKGMTTSGVDPTQLAPGEAGVLTEYKCERQPVPMTTDKVGAVEAGRIGERGDLQ